jgi:hypothetical protein
MSKKRLKESKEYFNLVAMLRILCDNKSELSGANPTWESEFMVDPHHIGGRIGDRYLDPFEIIMLTREEHDREEGKIRGMKPHSKLYLRTLIRPIRIKQGFKPNSKPY